ncbi:MAG: phosphonate C-P lyase system protein PhnH [Alphaproteobacteria bacterium]
MSATGAAAIASGPAAGFADPVFDAQRAFRALLQAMARPGCTVRPAPGLPAPAGLASAAYAVALTLCDADTPVWLQDGIATAQAVDSLRFHCGCRIVDAPGGAAFAFGDRSIPPLDRFATGDDRYPDRAATLVIALPALEGGPAVTLTGPGIDGETAIAPRGLPAWFWDAWARNHRLFPCGVDAMLVAGDALLGLPRSVAAVPQAGG